MYSTSQTNFSPNSPVPQTENLSKLPVPQTEKKHLNPDPIHDSTKEYQTPFQSQHSFHYNTDPSQSSSTGCSPINQYFNAQ